MQSRLLPVGFGTAALVVVIWFASWHTSSEDTGRAAAPSTHPARQASNAPVQSRALKVGTNELLVLDVPSEVSETAPLVETQRCYVWRDAEFKTSSLTCPPAADVGLPLAPPPPSYER